VSQVKNKLFQFSGKTLKKEEIFGESHISRQAKKRADE